MKSHDRPLYGSLYDQTLGLLPNYRGQSALVGRILRTSFERRAFVLDVGCGTGRLLALLEGKTTGHRLTGVDISPAMLAVAQSRCTGAARLVRADIATFLRRSRSSFDLIVLFFNFIQRYRSPRQLETLLRLMSASIRPGGFVLFDWHNEPALRRRFAESSVTRLRLPLAKGEGWTDCSITANHGPTSRLLKCSFKINYGHRRPKQLFTTHTLLALRRTMVDGLLRASALKPVRHLDGVTHKPMNARASWRAVTIAMRDWPIDQLIVDLEGRLKSASISTNGVYVIGSMARAMRMWRGTDVDVLVVVPAATVRSIERVYATCAQVAQDYGLYRCEFRQGPFKYPRGSQLHVILHSGATLLRVPVVTRLTWLASAGRLLPSRTLGCNDVSFGAVKRSARANNTRMMRELVEGHIAYREWSTAQRPQLRSKTAKWNCSDLTGGVLRYFVRASLSDLAVTLGEDPYDASWSPEGLSERSARVIERAVRTEGGKLDTSDVKRFLGEVSHLIASASRQTG